MRTGRGGVGFNGEISDSSFHTGEFSSSSSERCPGAGVAGAFRGMDGDSGFPWLSTAGAVANFGTGKCCCYEGTRRSFLSCFRLLLTPRGIFVFLLTGHG